jgi:hypothetical protein
MYPGLNAFEVVGREQVEFRANSNPSEPLQGSLRTGEMDVFALMQAGGTPTSLIGRSVFRIRMGTDEQQAYGNELVVRPTNDRISFSVCISSKGRADPLCHTAGRTLNTKDPCRRVNTEDARKGVTPTSPLPTEPPQDRTVAYWNSWIEHRDKLQEGPEIALEPGQVYIFTLDLSAFEYQQPGVFSGNPDPALLKELQRVQSDRMRIWVRPVLGGRGLDIYDKRQLDFQEMEINLNLLRHPPHTRGGGEPFPSFAARAHAGRYHLAIKTREEGGCGVIALSIWNDVLNRPLDHLLHTVTVKGPNRQQPACGPSGSKRKSLRAGLLSLLYLKPDGKADAALHLFKLTQEESAAIYVSDTGENYAWTFKGDLAAFVHSAGFIAAFDDGRRSNYEAAAEDLTNVFFSAQGKLNEGQANGARQALERLAIGDRPSKPTLFVRLVDEEGKNLFFPFGLLKIGSSLVGEHVTLLAPLPHETYFQPNRCLSRWTFVLPQTLAELGRTRYGGEYDKHVETLTKQNKWPLARTIKDFHCFLHGGKCSNASLDAQGLQGEGVVVLGHHDQGQIWFDKRRDYVDYRLINRPFPEGSVAVLAACNTGTLQQAPDRLAFLRELNNQGIDAAIVSPFELPMELGIAFVKHFDTTLLHAYERMEHQPDEAPPNLAELFSQAVEAVQKDPAFKGLKGDLRYELLVAGNSGLRLCPPRRSDR